MYDRFSMHALKFSQHKKTDFHILCLKAYWAYSLEISVLEI